VYGWGNRQENSRSGLGFKIGAGVAILAGMKIELSNVTSLARAVLVSTAILFVTGAGANQHPDAPDKPIPAISQRINAFTIDFLKHAAAKDTGNLILSPQSIYHGVAMSYVASGTKTRTELAKAVGFPDDDKQLTTDLAKLRKQIQSTVNKNTDVSIANSAWLDSTVAEFRKDYLSNLEKTFEASMYPVKFKNSKEASGRINKWVSEKTRSRISEVVRPQDFDSPDFTPCLVTVNVAYFKSEWSVPFEKADTKERPFRLNEKDSVNALLMHRAVHSRYGEDKTFQFLELPYTDSMYSMYVLLPKQVLVPKKMVSLVQSDTLAKLSDHAVQRSVDVLLPRFEIRHHCSAKDTLRNMGVALAFDMNRADFDRMIVKSPAVDRVFLSEIYHDAWVAADEKGTEAAAATTTMVAAPACAPPTKEEPPAVFHADHPFLFFIVHNESRSILFAGLVTNPKELAGDLKSK